MGKQQWYSFPTGGVSVQVVHKRCGKYTTSCIPCHLVVSYPIKLILCCMMILLSTYHTLAYHLMLRIAWHDTSAGCLDLGRHSGSSQVRSRRDEGVQVRTCYFTLSTSLMCTISLTIPLTGWFPSLHATLISYRHDYCDTGCTLSCPVW